MATKKVINNGTGWYVADFETSTYPNMEEVLKATNGELETFVWCYGISDVSKESKMVKRGTDIGEFIDYIKTALPHDSIVFFHNLKFDGSFIMDFLERCKRNDRFGWNGILRQSFHAYPNRLTKSGYVKKGKKIEREYFPVDTLIDTMGNWYSVTLNIPQGDCINGVYEEVKTIKIWNSLLKIPLPVSVIGKVYGGEILKGDIHYDLLRLPGYQPTAEEWDYLDRDCLIVANALYQHYEMGHTNMTLASDCMADYKNELKLWSGLNGKAVFESLYPKLMSDTYKLCKSSYRGGYVYLMEERAYDKDKSVTFDKIVGYDINSSFPSIMRYMPLPYGVKFETIIGELKGEHKEELYIAKVKITELVLKEGYVPIVPIGNNYKEHVPILDTVITSIELHNIQKHYTYKSFKIEWYMVFEAATGSFDTYIDKWNEIKRTSKGGQRQIAKLFLNSLYGKFGSNPVHKNVNIRMVDGVIKCGEFEISEDEESMYLFVASFITAYAREKLYNAIQANYDRFIYCDTDSIYLMGHEDAVGIEVDDTKLGAWKKETIGTDARFLKPKCYSYFAEGHRTYKAAGIPEAAKETINFDTDFYRGHDIEGKLSGKIVKGGTVLVPTKYTL